MLTSSSVSPLGLVMGLQPPRARVPVIMDATATRRGTFTQPMDTFTQPKSALERAQMRLAASGAAPPSAPFSCTPRSN